MALNWTTTDQSAIEAGIKMLIWGDSGAGKTRLAGTLDPATTLILSAENGLLSLRQHNINALRIDNVQDLADAFTFCQSPAAANIKNVVLDSLTEIGEQVLVNAKKLVKDPRQAYGELIEKVMDLAKKFRGLEGKNIIFLCKLERFQDTASGVTMFGPSMPGKSVGPQLPYLFDEVFKIDSAVHPETKEKYHFLQTGKDAQNVCKDRSGALAMYEPADLNHILSKIIPSTTPTTGA